MLNKKTFICILLILITVSYSAVSAESDFVSVNVFGQVYYGTLTSDDSKNSVFTSVSDLEIPFQITGKWKNDSFTGKCSISYDDGVTQEVTYKKGSISGTFLTYYEDGTYSQANCSDGILCGKIEYFNRDKELIGTDWYHYSVPIQSWVKQAANVSYETLLEFPFDYIETPVVVIGHVSDIYCNSNGNMCYLKINDKNNNPYIFYYNNVDVSTKYEAFSNMENLSPGDSVTIYGIFENMIDWSEAPYTLCEYQLGYQIAFSELEPQLVDPNILNRIADLCSVEDTSFENTFPLVRAIYCKKDGISVDELHLEKNYKNICQYPFSYTGEKTTISGTVLYDTFDTASQKVTMLIDANDAQEYYIVRQKLNDIKDADEFQSLCGKHVSVHGKQTGNKKIPYLRSSQVMGYVLYPGIKADRIELD